MTELELRSHGPTSCPAWGGPLVDILGLKAHLAVSCGQNWTSCFTVSPNGADRCARAPAKEPWHPLSRGSGISAPLSEPGGPEASEADRREDTDQVDEAVNVVDMGALGGSLEKGLREGWLGVSGLRRADVRAGGGAAACRDQGRGWPRGGAGARLT